MKLVFMGTPDFALPSLDLLHAAGHEIAAVVTVPDKPAGRGQNLRPSAVKIRALELGLPVLQPDDLHDPIFIKRLQDLAAQLYIVVAFRILPPAVFTLPAAGTINLHASLLPKYRGAAPINWALINSETETGVTTFFLDEKVDTGLWLKQARVAIGPDTTAGELFDQLSELGAEVLLQTVKELEAGVLQSQAQSGTVTRAPKITKELAQINWQQPAAQVHNLIRGLSPYPAAFTFFKGKLLKVLRSALHESQASAAPGTIIPGSTPDELVVATGQGAVRIIEIQPEGGRPMAVAAYLRGHPIAVGEKFDAYEHH